MSIIFEVAISNLNFWRYITHNCFLRKLQASAKLKITICNSYDYPQICFPDPYINPLFPWNFYDQLSIFPPNSQFDQEPYKRIYKKLLWRRFPQRWRFRNISNRQDLNCDVTQGRPPSIHEGCHGNGFLSLPLGLPPSLNGHPTISSMEVVRFRFKAPIFFYLALN